jgi:hypothetical protein
MLIPVASVPRHPGGPRAAETRSPSPAVVVSAPRLRLLIPFGSSWYFLALHACTLQVTSITPTLPSNQHLFVADLVLHVPPSASVRSRRSISCMLQYSTSVQNRPCCQGGCFPTSRNNAAVPHHMQSTAKLVCFFQDLQHIFSSNPVRGKASPFWFVLRTKHSNLLPIIAQLFPGPVGQ